MRLLAGALLLLLGTATVRAESDIELLNATLVAKFHFAEVARDGQMVGAYQVSFRNNGDTPVSKISLLLNPGLQVDKVVGPGGKTLKLASRVTAVTGMHPLELNVAELTLPKPLRKGESRLEIVVHYRGYLEDLSVFGLAGVQETLSPKFSMIRAQSFGYPVFATPDQASIAKALAHKPFYQVAFLDIPGTNSMIGNLDMAQKSTNGEITKFEMKSDHPTALMTLAIGPYRARKVDMVELASLANDGTDPGMLVDKAERHAQVIRQALGTPHAPAMLTLAALPQGFSSFRANGVLFMDPATMERPETVAQVETALFDLWRANPGFREGHWGTGLDVVLDTAFKGNASMEQLKQAIFADIADTLKSSPGMGKTAIMDMAVDGYAGNLDATGTLAFAALYGLLGQDEFFAMARNLRESLSAGYADMQSVADTLDRNLRNKAARKFAENWFTKGRIGKDMAKASSFEELVALYR